MFKGLKEKVNIVNEHMGTFSKELEILVISTITFISFVLEFHMESYGIYSFVSVFFSWKNV